MKSKTICLCIPGRKQKEGKKGSSKSHQSSKRRDLHSAGPGDHVEASYEGATTSTDVAGVAAVVMRTAVTEAAIHGTDGGSAHGGGGGDGGSSHGGGGDGGGGG
ncbi:hypothetical protein TorRG33x02_214580 [Trema orientale]|uniref:Uncharacterized protein n=1 Tax=Trema orientale TaxID=63057 RepID=A0A2P5EAW1_TREOI|nr:hypothetical protein TorRG33x02_214580 [Trema orientale]